MPTLTELHDAALRGDLDLPARAASAASPARQATTLAATHATGALRLGTALDEALTLYLRGAHSNSARTLERTDIAFAAEDELPRALLRVLCYLHMHRNGKMRGRLTAGEYLRQNALPMLARFDSDGRSTPLRDAIRDALRG